MYFRVCISTISLLSVCFFTLGCGISLRVYRPFPKETAFEYVKKMDHIQIFVKEENRMKMGVYDGYFLTQKDFPMNMVPYLI